MDSKSALRSHNTQLTDAKSCYIQAASSDNTRLAYQSDIKHFLSAGFHLPATDVEVEQYLRQAADHQNPRTLVRRLTALRQWHRLQNVTDPTQSPLVMKTLKGIKRLHGRPRRQALTLRLEDLDQLVKHLNQQDSLLSIRNKALLLVGFFGAFRRSELVAMHWEDVRFVNDGMIITLARSKTDQGGEGQQCVIPFGNEDRCPVRALLDWRKASKAWNGPIFRRLSKTGRLLKAAITDNYLNKYIQQLARDAKLPNSELYSCHSLRRGFATEAARLGASMPAIQRHGRWKSVRTVIEYIEAGRQFKDSAVNVLFKF